jgi:acyl-CoA hydrolase
MINEKLAKETKTRTTRAIFPGETNHYQTLFGGTALNWMDEIAFITATRYGRKKFVTVSSDRIDFKNSIPEGSIVELIGEVIKVGNTSLVVKVEIVVEDMYSRNKHVAVDGNFTFVAIDDNKNPLKIHD